jgi:hypothetical protein
MKASARKVKPPKSGDSIRYKDKKAVEKAKMDAEVDTTGSENADEPSTVLEVEGQQVIGEEAIGILEQPLQVSGKKPKRHHKRPKRGVPKNYPFDASLLLEANPPYALGETLVDSVHLYQMGKKDETGAYIVLEEIKLFD